MKQVYLDTLKHFLSIPSVSTQEEHLENMKEARHFLVDLFHSMGFTTHVLKSKKHDAVFAQNLFDPKFPTVLIYGHYDVQPAQPLDQWATPPFEPTVKNNIIYARGATDNKGQIMSQIMGVKTYLENTKDPRVNFKFIIEGEEEIGSISVEKLVREHGRDLFKCDYIIVSDTEMPSKGQPSIDISLRGLLYTEIEIETSKQDLHSGQFGGVAENPAILLARIITELKDKNNHVLIPKFYDDVRGSTKKEAKYFAASKISSKQLQKEGDFYGIGGGEDFYSLNERRWTRPTLDVNGLVSGYTGEGSKTIIPSKSSAKISMRLVPNQDPEKIYQNFAKFVKRLVPKGAKLKITRHADALPYRAPTDHPVFDLIMQSQQKIFGKPSVFYGVGGSIGFIPIMANSLNVPCMLIGLGLPDEALHAPNEHYSLDNFYKGIETMVDFYNNLPTLK